MLALFVAFVGPPSGARADDVLVAVASNFAPVAARLAERFEAASLHDVRLVTGSTGKLYAQIVRGGSSAYPAESA